MFPWNRWPRWPPPLERELRRRSSGSAGHPRDPDCVSGGRSRPAAGVCRAREDAPHQEARRSRPPPVQPHPVHAGSHAVRHPRAEVIEEDRATGKRVIRFIRGPIFSNIILADEINRTPPKTQAALLEAMQEYQVTVTGIRYDLERPLFVLATQNPIEQEGTYPLPEAQLDRFMFNVVIEYPSAEEERRILSMTTGTADPGVSAVATGEEIERLHLIVRDVPAAENIVDYAARLVRATRPAGEEAPEFVRKWVRWGAGPRAGQALLLGARPAPFSKDDRRGLRRNRRRRPPGPAAPRARELPGRGRRHRRRRDRQQLLTHVKT